MRAGRYKEILGQKVEEFYWAGKYVTYINNHFVEKDYDEVTEEYLSKELA